MFQLLHKYFILYKELALPGFGVFYFQRRPAILNFPNRQFIAPGGEVIFSEGNSTNEQALFMFLANEQQLSEAEATRSFISFSLSLKDRLQKTGTVTLPGIGELTRDNSGKLYFKSKDTLNSFYKNVPLEQPGDSKLDEEVNGLEITQQAVAGQPTETEVQVKPIRKDYWWIYALVMTAVAIAAIFYYYNVNGSLR